MDETLTWLLDSDPAIRWQTMRDLTDEPVGRIVAERARVASEGWGARLLELQGEDGQWGGGAYSPKWISTTYTLLLLRHLGVDPEDRRVRSASDLVRERITMGQKDLPFFEYVGETCISAMALTLNVYFLGGERARVDWLLDEQRGDGGWNCDSSSPKSSFNTTISALEALSEYCRAQDADPAVADAVSRAHEYLLERQLMYSLSTGELINRRWLLMSFPPRWHYDVLRGLDHLRESGRTPDPRCDRAIDVIRSKRREDGTWPLQNPHAGKVHFEMEEGPGKPSRWNTLRALRVLDWQGPTVR